MNRTKRNSKPEEGIDLLHIAIVLLKHRKFILIFTASAAALILLFAFVTAVVPPQFSMLPDVYRAYAVISINQRAYSDVLSSIFSPGASQELTMDMTPTFLSFSYGEYIIRLIQTKSILNKIGEEFDIAERYGSGGERTGRMRKALLKHLYLDYDEKTMTVTISFEDYDSVFSQKVTNRFVELLDERILELKENRSTYQKDLLEKKLVEVKDQLGDLEDRMKQLQAKYGVLRSQELSEEKLTVLANLRSQLILKEMEIRTYENSATIEDPTLRRLRAERNNLQRLINELEKGSSRLQDQLPSQKLLPEIVLEFAHLERDLKIQEKIYEILLQEFQITKIKLSLVGEEPLFQLLEDADVPDTKYGPNRSLLCLSVTVVAFGIACVLVLLYHSLKKKNII
ncbi:MAG TPA: hypothetical protein ENN69_05200, partial [Spirochaetia bacterium]|nr:hypothetical protein [Spirochaetia bacterium]